MLVRLRKTLLKKGFDANMDRTAGLPSSCDVSNAFRQFSKISIDCSVTHRSGVTNFSTLVLSGPS